MQSLVILSFQLHLLSDKSMRELEPAINFKEYECLGIVKYKADIIMKLLVILQLLYL